MAAILPRPHPRYLRAALLAVAVIAGALLIRFCLAPIRSTWIQAPLQSEPFHVLAHTLIYGGIAWVLRGARSGRAIGGAMLAALCQEAAQVAGQRPFGSGEWFDLGVDLVAASAAVALARAVSVREGPAR